jgi:hypothetical protein
LASLADIEALSPDVRFVPDADIVVIRDMFQGEAIADQLRMLP